MKKKVAITKPMPANFVPLSQHWVGRKPLFLGYGLIQSVPSAVSPNRKYSVELPIISVRSDRFSHRASGKSVCHGDSGGPAVVLLGGRMRVIGVNSYVSAARVPGTTRSTCAGTGTSTRTDTFAAFLQSVLNTYGDGAETCAKNEECGQCAQCNTSKKTCEVLRLKKNSSLCKPCRSDADCGGGLCYRFPNGFRCLQPCTTKSCCPDQFYCSPLPTQSGLHNLCMPFVNTCPTLACKKDSDCGPGEFCENSSCLPQAVAREPALCRPCTEHSQCGKTLCYGLPGQKRCTQACGAGDFCPPGYVCAQPFPGVSKQCIPNNGACFMPCTFDSHCAAWEICTKGVCSSKQGGSYGESCDPAPCQPPLVCTTTISGKRCLEPCNHPDGYAGSACRGGSRCESGLGCFSLTSELRLCLASCRSSADCQSKGGGQCSSGICYCFSNSQCRKGFVCNQNSRELGACAPAAESRKCTNPLQCKAFKGRSFCVGTGIGTKTLGQSCDALNQCRRGLRCISTTDGGVCFEFCDSKQKCTLGGICVGVGGGVNACMCTGSNGCPKGRICRPYVQRGLAQYGLCVPLGLKNPCVGDRECPVGYLCRRGQCLTPEDAEKVPPNEPQPRVELSREATPEVDVEQVEEPEPLREPIVESEPKQDAGTSDDRRVGNSDSPSKTPAKGCGCEVNRRNSPLPSLGWLLFLGLWGLSRRRRTR